MTLKARRNLVTILFHGGILFVAICGMLLGTALARQEIALPFSAMLLLHLLSIRINPIPRLVSQKVLTETTCPQCGRDIDLVDIWKCPCGFTEWSPRHAFSACRHCNRIFSWIDCPSCGTSIRI